MRKIFFLTFILFLSIYACKKKVDVNKVIDGKWKIVSANLENINFWSGILTKDTDTTAVSAKIKNNIRKNLVDNFIVFNNKTKTCRIGDSRQIYSWVYDEEDNEITMNLQDENIKNIVNIVIEDISETKMTIIMQWNVSGYILKLKLQLEKYPQ